jgi:hypothetical protein
MQGVICKGVGVESRAENLLNVVCEQRMIRVLNVVRAESRYMLMKEESQRLVFLLISSMSSKSKTENKF